MIQKGLAGVVVAESAISQVDGESGECIYRGKRVRELTDFTFEEVAFFLLHGTFPSDEEKAIVMNLFKQQRILPEEIDAMITKLPAEIDLMSVLRTCISAMGEKEASQEEAMKLTATMPTIIARRLRFIEGKDAIEPRTDLNHVENYVYMLTGEMPTHVVVQALTTYMILTMEHGMNASTFTARVIASTEADYISVITGAIGAMKGPLHGGAPTGVLEMLRAVKTDEEIEPFIEKKLRNGEKLMGFGHRVYKTKDPRAQALKGVLERFGQSNDTMNRAVQFERLATKMLATYKPGRDLYVNVEFYAAALMDALALDERLFTPTFTMSRIVGWSAHIMEQRNDNRIYRPSHRYTGEMPAQSV
ncbi:citrate/2-methylcitrate synthase [Shouchella sp. 1P09AA]|uniref:citrate/2-methylcitrate synthase n=1 Tax=unclassified Shouchella TaxID=2893065 RepID=UPI0039A15AE8